LKGIYVAFNGDLISGDIHQELKETNALTSHNQVWFVTDRCIAIIANLVKQFGYVHACFTCGNHGRNTEKTHSKRTSDHSYDTMIGENVRRHFQNDPRVFVMVAPGRDAEYSILNWKVLQTHLDTGGGGGQGWAGPTLPITRKGKQIEYVASKSRIFYDIILTAHHHVSTNPTDNHLGNGSVVGANEFSLIQIRAAPEPPMQWLTLVTEKWPMRERMPIKLEDVPRIVVTRA
jgi:hypothetical protein